MAVLKSYTCSKCAGVLLFDSDQEFFDCPFCGTKFNAVDFHGDEILDQAKDCLKKRSFDAAKDKYLIVLDNDPQNFDALLGIVFCELKISSAEELNDRSVLLNRDLIPAKKALINAKRQLPKNEADYFDKIMDLIGLHEKITKYEKRKIELLSSNAAQISINNKLLEGHREDRYRDRSETVHRWWPLILIVMPFLAFVELLPSTWMIVLFFSCLIGGVVLAIVLLTIRDKKKDEAFNPAHVLEQTFERKIKGYESDYSLEYEKLDGLYPETHSAGKAVDELVKISSFNGADIDAGKVISCSKCAAKLILDKEKRVYQCDHCGVAYGVSLFFGLPMEKALDSINTGHYSDAKKRFDSILMSSPSDFEALLGRMLCEGKWTKISDIDLSDDLSITEVREIKKCLAEAIERTSDDERSYFAELEKLISVYEENFYNAEDLEQIDAEIDKFDIETDVFAEAFHGIYYRQQREEERNAIMKKAYPYQIKRKNCAAEFNSLRRTIINMRSDSVLCK